MSLLGALADALDRRLGWRERRARAIADLSRPVPPHVGWAYTLGSTALALLVLQIATGIALALHYQPTPEAAHASVAHIQDRVRLGWLVRSAHAWGAHFLVALLLAHAARVFLTGGHKKPRELTWVLGAKLLFITLALAFTGQLLPWSELSYWGAVVGLEQVRITPAVGPAAGDLLAGGPGVGPATLTRFYVLHILLLPALAAALLAAHLALVRRLGIAPLASTAEEDAQGHDALCAGGDPYVPHHILKEAAVAIVAAAALVTAAALWPPELGARAGRTTPPGIRPEWYFLAVYQYLKYWPSTIFGVPGEKFAVCLLIAATTAFAALPFLDRSPERRPARRKLALAVAGCFLFAWTALTLLGSLSENELSLFGHHWRFDTYGRPK
ncbi:MAG: cytochrome bc complex cytochrome b subunit [Planctomycetes bacterium]|nr:cytochrome bc complex cytochrome b subunit [Planctomycetota bacterium]